MAARPAVVLEALERSAVESVRTPVRLSPKDSKYAEIELVLGSELPPSARKYAAWWKTVKPESGGSPATQVWKLPRR